MAVSPIQGSFFSGVLLAALTVACSVAPAGRPTTTTEQPQSAGPIRILVLAHRYEPTNLLPKVQQSNNPSTTTRLFSAALALIDDRGAVAPYLAESTPHLNTDSWRVLPDGGMETTYRLRPGLTWHDGAPLIADDFVFSLQVYKDRELGVFRAAPQDGIDAIEAPDARTVLIRWRSTNPRAGSLVQCKDAEVAGIFEDLHRSGVARIDLDRPEGLLAHDAIDTEHAL